MSRIQCPTIVQYVESGMAKSRDVYWIVMEFLQGDSLEKCLNQHGPMTEVEVIRVM
jgi:serine/threonine protein kinase